MFLDLFLAFVIGERLIELFISKKNAKYIQSLGGYEVGKKHYPFIVILHIMFLTSFYLESLIRPQLPSYWYIPFSFFVFLQVLRYWVIFSLGMFWNTRIFVLPNSKPINKGPYRFLRHPNYLIVILEMITIPLIFGSYLTMIIFPIINAVILYVRIKTEEQALTDIIAYEQEMKDVPRFVPKKIH